MWFLFCYLDQNTNKYVKHPQIYALLPYFLIFCPKCIKVQHCQCSFKLKILTSFLGNAKICFQYDELSYYSYFTNISYNLWYILLYTNKVKSIKTLSPRPLLLFVHSIVHSIALVDKIFFTISFIKVVVLFYLFLGCISYIDIISLNLLQICFCQLQHSSFNRFPLKNLLSYQSNYPVFNLQNIIFWSVYSI